MNRKPIIGLTTDFDQDRQAHYTPMSNPSARPAACRC